MHDFRGKRVVVMGLGRFGGGVGVCRYLHREGVHVLATDMLGRAELTASVKQLADCAIDYRLGEHREADFAAADLVVVNPAVDPRDNVYLQAAREAGVPLTSEIQLFIEACCTGAGRLRTIGVTGTAGKSTTVTMIGHVLEQASRRQVPKAARVWVGGNIGGSLLDHMDEIAPDDWIVLELSSFMLEAIAPMRWSPHIAVLTNFSPNHLDRHGTLEAYRAAKQQLFEYQVEAEGDTAIGGPGVHDVFDNRVSDFRTFDAQHVTADAPIALRVPGAHNQFNARLAAEAVNGAIDQPVTESYAALADFAGLPHRLQFVTERAGVRYFNDSKATTPAAALLAIECFERRTVQLIAGGVDKGADMRAFGEQLAARCAGVYTIGVAGEAIAHAADPIAEYLQALDRAVATAATQARPGDVVLLSPGCASWDQFDNYEQRGVRFVELVEAVR